MRPEPKDIPAAPPSPSRFSWLYRDEKVTAKPWVNYLGIALIAIQFFVVLRLLERFKLESDAFRLAFSVGLVAFIIHALLPMRARLPFFLAVSIGITAYILGLERAGFNLMTSLQRMGTLLVLGGALIAVCHLPIPFYARAGILVAAGIALAVIRSNLLSVPALGPLWPVFGAMFMFRLALYLYDLEHEKEKPRLSRSLTYFFMMPNVALTLFPVVDYKHFSKNYYNEEHFQAYQRGVHWMARGAIQLVLWRLVYYHVHVGPTAVQTGADLARFIISNVLLYMRVSGEFHLVIGMLTLFGFNLPETNKKYFFADSFLDYWRRVNIYWKDFMMKIVFYPTIFRMKTWNQTTAMIVATALAFVVTWALHSYQWFWLRGQFPVITQDIIFWSMLGVLVIVNSVWEQKKGRSRTLGSKTVTMKDHVIANLKVAGVFTTMAILWSFWNCESVPQWLGMMSVADGNTVLWLFIANVVLIASKLFFDRFLTPAPAPKKKLGEANKPKIIPVFPFKPAILFVGIPLFAVFFFTSGRVVRRMGPGAEVVVASLASTKPNAADQAQMERGYYDDLMEVGRFNQGLNESLTGAPADWKKLEETDAMGFTNDYRVTVLVPSKQSIVNGKKITVNRWGMRDKEYELEKAPGTFRIAIMGSSHVMGWGVSDDNVFEKKLEERMNKELAGAGKNWERVEILNFGVNGYSPACQITHFEKSVAQFKPDAVWMVSHNNDTFWIASRFAKAIRKGVPLPERYSEIQKKLEIDAHTPDLWAQRKLRPYLMDMVKWSYAELGDHIRAIGAEAVWILIPGIADPINDEGLALQGLAQEAGFKTMVMPYTVYKGLSREELEIASWDAHPNAQGHQLIADQFFEMIVDAKHFRLFTRSAGTQTSTRAQ
jgi:D-alanyl-lipoteichoic acid acyltransferase DltB (MBOAT superfamily)